MEKEKEDKSKIAHPLAHSFISTEIEIMKNGKLKRKRALPQLKKFQLSR